MLWIPRLILCCYLFSFPFFCLFTPYLQFCSCNPLYRILFFFYTVFHNFCEYTYKIPVLFLLFFSIQSTYPYILVQPCRIFFDPTQPSRGFYRLFFCIFAVSLPPAKFRFRSVLNWNIIQIRRNVFDKYIGRHSFNASQAFQQNQRASVR